jgi:hypothetical protein
MIKLVQITAFLATGLHVASPENAATTETTDRLIKNFPAVNQGLLSEAEFRCGSIALGSWLIWLTKNEGLPMPTRHEGQSSPVFDRAGLTAREQVILTEVDTLAGGRGEISLLRLVETLIHYTRRHAGDAKLEIYYYNLPDESLLHQLVEAGLPALLLQGIYKTNQQSEQFERVRGHYSCLIGKNEDHLIANTFAQNQAFSIRELPMNQLIESDRYRPTGSESYLYLRCPPEELPHYTFRAFAPSNADTARKQVIHGKPLFARADETILIEGALAFRVVGNR